MIKRRLLSPQERTMPSCDELRELSNTFYCQLQTCKQMDLSVALVMIEVVNIDELRSIDPERADYIVETIAQRLLVTVRTYDILARYRGKYIALLLVDADQHMASKICQRIKEAEHKHSYFHKDATPYELAFGISDDSANHDAEPEFLVREAMKALQIAHTLGDGAIVRMADLEHSQHAHPSPSREHFFPGDKLGTNSDN